MPLKLVPGSKVVKATKGFEKCLLHEVLRVDRIAGEPDCDVVERGKQGEGVVLKR